MDTFHSYVIAVGGETVVLGLATFVLPHDTGQTQPPAADGLKPPEVASRPQPKPLTPGDRLKAIAERYSKARTYRDEGEVQEEMDTEGMSVTSVMPFRTAFERGGRFYWHFKGSATPGAPPTDTYTVWSENQQSFESYWTMNERHRAAPSMNRAMAGPSAISGGSALAVIPLLCPDMQCLRTTALADAADEGTENVDGAECTKVKGTQARGQWDVTVWIDKDFAIRKMYVLQRFTAPPKAFTTRTTITIKPVFDEKLEDELFTPPDMNK